MTSKEIVTRAIEFKRPERLPVDFSSFGITDLHSVKWNQIVPWEDWEDWREKKLDEWSCGWSRTEVKNMGQVTEHPLSDWSALDSYKWPDPDNKQFYEGMSQRFEGSEGKYVITQIFMLLFERMHSLRGFENLLTDLYLEKEKIENLADRIVDFDISIIKNISSRFPGQIHGFKFSDDWGTQLSTFISPKLWDEFFKPRYKKIFDACRLAGWHIWMHSCGRINDLIPGLIDVGVNVLELQQPRVLGIEEIGRRFAGKVCFLGCCDIQRTLPSKDEKVIRKEAGLLLDCWATEDGGFILQDSGNGEDLGFGTEPLKIMLDAFMEHDPWKKPYKV